MRKRYTLKNGYTIAKDECYNGHTMQGYWGIYEPSGRLYMSCATYNEAYEIASHLIGREF